MIVSTEVLVRTQDTLIVAWTDDKDGFGQLTMVWNDGLSKYILDSELLHVDSVIEIIKAVK